jgi:hypothetical protein
VVDEAGSEIDRAEEEGSPVEDGGGEMTAHCPHCGGIIEKSRSRNQHNRLFALATAAYHHWPSSHEFRPKSVDHLRYWLTVEAGRFDVEKTIRVRSVEPDALLALLTAVMSTSKDEQQFVDLDGELITVRRAHSIKTTGAEAMPQREFSILCGEVESVLEANGMDPQQLLRETQSAA